MNKTRLMRRSRRRSRSKSGGVGEPIGYEGNSSLKNSAPLSGGRSRRHRKYGRSKTSKRSRKGGFGIGIVATIKEALVPFGLYALQKRSQRKSSRRYN